MKRAWWLIHRWGVLGGIWLLSWGYVQPVSGTVNLDAFLSCLESNGVLADREAAEWGGITGVLRSIDPGMVTGQVSALGEAVMSERRPVPGLQAVELWPENLAYIKASGLVPGSGEELLGHFKSLNSQWGILFDLRGACGEDFKSVCVLAGLVRHSHEPIFFLTDNRGIVLETNIVEESFTRMPLLLILIDGDTSGASEALASVLKGGSGVLVMGAITRGDMALRDWLSLPGGKRAWMATRKWAPVAGSPVSEVGVRPDIVLAGNSDLGNEYLSRSNQMERVLSVKSDSDRELMMRVAGDPVLQRATDILLGLQALGGYERK